MFCFCQLSLYAYLYYIENGFFIDKGIITKVDKENPRNRISREVNLLPLNEIKELILNHPTIRFYFNEISEREFLQACKKRIIDYKETWLCSNCQYKEECKVYTEIKLYLEKLKKEKKNDKKKV